MPIVLQLHLLSQLFSHKVHFSTCGNKFVDEVMVANCNTLQVEAAVPGGKELNEVSEGFVETIQSVLSSPRTFPCLPQVSQTFRKDRLICLSSCGELCVGLSGHRLIKENGALFLLHNRSKTDRVHSRSCQ